ncbi:hypothetical protein ACFP1I_23380 [Dyadobacter subterraneus]|uniref:hypothetical protein n=1 Tax=Dyadobacter subterraneus TaxID=2773304 RepID=UPI001D16BF89|nr:hypothetical protein [Dyadobacter subterraneus]
MADKIRYKTKIVIIGAGQAGLSAAYHLKKLGLSIGPDFVVLMLRLRQVVPGNSVGRHSPLVL